MFQQNECEQKEKKMHHKSIIWSSIFYFLLKNIEIKIYGIIFDENNIISICIVE